MRETNHPTVIDALRRTFRRRKTIPASWRRQQLKRLAAMLRENEAVFAGALYSDLKKSAFESYFSETGFVLSEIRHALKHLSKWMRPSAVATPPVLLPARSKIVHQPLGVALILGAWNYPLMLTLAPLAACMAAGNCAVVKPSELAPAVSAAMAEWIPRYLDNDAVVVVEGGVSETTELLKLKFDKIFFTGSGNVGRIVMTAAARHLTPVTLELGGKSPCIVDRDVNIDVAARRIVFGKYLNAGQTCVAPDYVLVHKKRKDDLLAGLARHIRRFYGPDPRRSPDYARIVNDRHFQRLVDLLGSGRHHTGGTCDPSDRYIAPTVLTDVSPDAAVMQEEIFGPILPVLAVADMDDAIGFVNDRDPPLSLYLFSENDDTVGRVTAQTTAGGMCVNETLFHLAVPELPFGGVGPSGMGNYHGRWGFQAFSHAKALLTRSTLFDPALRYPPYSERAKKLLRIGLSL
jgi:aldehyde dehydrogenase (NAD+)